MKRDDDNVYCARCGHMWWLHNLRPLFRLFATCPECGEDGPLLLNFMPELNEEGEK